MLRARILAMDSATLKLLMITSKASVRDAMGVFQRTRRVIVQGEVLETVQPELQGVFRP
jgi:hypothetical protein